MATMKEIAELAGVSRGTVDRVLNRRGSVSPLTKKKILEIVEMLDYKPNKAGIALSVQKKSLTIGVILFGAGNAFFDDVIEGVESKLGDLSIYGIHLITRRIPFGLDEELAAIDQLLADGINGLVLSPYNDDGIRAKIDRLWDEGIPVVTTNTDIPESRRIAYVGSDFYSCGQTAAALFHRFAPRPLKLAIVTGSDRILCHKDRIRGFLDYCRDLKPPIEIAEVIEAHDDDYESYEAVTQLLARYPDLDGLYYTASGMYGGCRGLMHARKMQSSPDDSDLCIRNSRGNPFLLIGFDSVPSSKEMLRKGLITATITQQPQLQGSLSVGILQDYLVSGKLPDREIYHTELSIKLRENL
nr:substrate-binding domain-containing protein [Shuttleworthia satelles]